MYNKRHGFKIFLAIVAIIAVIFGLVKLLELSNNVGPTLANTQEEYSGIIPHMEKISHNTENSCWSYYVDHTTNRIYLVYCAGYQFGMSAVFNSDGTPMTLDQLLALAD